MNIIYTISAMISLCALGCTHKKSTLSSQPSLHNYPRYLGECPPIPPEKYNQVEVKRKADALGMRSVDYLHLINKQIHNQ
jgi:hypothetical protein